MGAKGRLRLALPLGAVLALLSVSGSPAATTTIDATSGSYGSYVWSPAQAETTPGGSIAFRSNSAGVPHGVTWTGGPATPTCSGVPIDDGKTSWSGTCSFAQAGTYTYVCYVHPTEMKGTVTASAGATLPGDPPPTGPGTGPPSGPVASDLRLPRSQRGGSVRGSIQLLRAGAGSRLEVGLTADRARLLGPGHAGRARVGRLVRSSPPDGRFSFSVALVRSARDAIADGGSLALTATVAVTSPEGDVLKRSRGVVMLSQASPGRDRR